MSAKVLIVGLPNTGKTSLIKTLKNTFVISRDGKPFPLEIPYVNMPDFTSIQEFIDLATEKLNKYEEKFGGYPETVVFDSVSRIATDIVTNCQKQFNGFDIWNNVDKEIAKFNAFIAEIQEAGINLVIIAHAMYDAESKKYIETSQGKFGKMGGFLSTVDYAIHIDMVGSKRIVSHKSSGLSRTLLEDMPDKEGVETFNLQDYLDKIKEKSDKVAQEFSI